ncbi:MAG: hypothetical protein HZB26_18825 [Candidatus Hydrogenedentes bacterium]|nr:hypothetical protein [Candidatus Hydrogenedentota bacterium]
MSPVKRVCAFYSVGPHYARMLDCLRSDYPNAAIDAWIPPALTAPDAAQDGLCDVVRTEAPHYSPANFAACARLVRQLRGHRYDIFAVMFDSAQLQVLAALSGAQVRLHITPRGKQIPLRSSIAGIACDWLYGILKGRIVYLWVWLAARLFKVKR